MVRAHSPVRRPVGLPVKKGYPRRKDSVVGRADRATPGGGKAQKPTHRGDVDGKRKPRGTEPRDRKKAKTKDTETEVS
jgi:hypothetical protein